jgi:hypothetical protein
MDGHFDTVADTCQGFIDRVIDDLVHQMMQRFLIGTTHVHTRAAAYCFETLENLNVFCTI